MKAATGLAAALVSALVAGCVPHPAAPPPPTGSREITIAPPTNLTGEQLVVSGGSMLETWVLRSDRVTVPDLLASEAESTLRARGYQATAHPAGTGGSSFKMGFDNCAPIARPPRCGKLKLLGLFRLP